MTLQNQNEVGWGYSDKGEPVLMVPEGLRFATVEIPGDFQIWDQVGDSVEGKYLSSEDLDIQGNATFKYNFQTGPDPDVDLKSCHGTYVLDDLMKGVSIGEYCRITYLGTNQTKSDRMVKIFRVEKLTQI